MKRRLLGTITALGAVGLTAGAVPAFTADSGTINVSITAEAPAETCLTLSPEAIDYGTLPLSASGGGGSSGTETVLATNCGTVDQNLNVVATNPAGPSGEWTLSDEGGNLCDTAPLDAVYVHTDFEGNAVPIATTPRTVVNRFGLPVGFPPGITKDGQLELHMPCRGSNGAGESKTFTVTYIAVAE